MWLYAFVFVSGLWLLGLTFFLWQMRRHYLRLTRRTGRENIESILEQLLDKAEKNNMDIKQVREEMKLLADKSRKHLNKISMVSFNPFGRTEGEKSFVVAVLNEEKNGMVTNFIYTHDGLRVYSKMVEKGIGKEHPLSKEEEEAVNKAT